MDKEQKINRKTFFDKIRNTVFKGKISQAQVENMDLILNEWELRKLTDLRWLAYMFGTIFHETGHTMRPVKEFGEGQGHAYGKRDPETGKVYYGRGYVQITWKSNYEKFTKLTGLDLVHYPDLALETPTATIILFEGMINGMFTTKKLSDYFNQTLTDWVNARRIINGVDRAELIADYSKDFFSALK